MILKVTNISDHSQQITLHTGESKIIDAGLAIQINTGVDKRLIGYYASLVNYEFDISEVSASGQESNYLADYLSKFNSIKKVTESNKVLQENKIYPEQKYESNIPTEPKKPYNPVTLDSKSGPTYNVTKSVQESTPTQLIDEKVGEPIQDLTPVLPDDYPEDPKAVAEVKRLEQQEKEATDNNADRNEKYELLDKLDENALKQILYDKFNESTKLRSKWKIIYHILDLCEDQEVNILELVNNYR